MRPGTKCVRLCYKYVVDYGRNNVVFGPHCNIAITLDIIHNIHTITTPTTLKAITPRELYIFVEVLLASITELANYSTVVKHGAYDEDIKK